METVVTWCISIPPKELRNENMRQTISIPASAMYHLPGIVIIDLVACHNRWNDAVQRQVGHLRKLKRGTLSNTQDNRRATRSVPTVIDFEDRGPTLVQHGEPGEITGRQEHSGWRLEYSSACMEIGVQQCMLGGGWRSSLFEF